MVFTAIFQKMRLLKWSAAIVATLLSTVYFAAGNFYFLLSVIFFFGTSALWGKLPVVNAIHRDEKAGKPRDYLQVLANGLVPALFLIAGQFFEVKAFVIAAWVSLAFATSDTWSSEIGSRLKGKTVNLFTGKRVTAGVSGGISVIGLLAGIMGSISIAMLSRILLHYNWKEIVAIAGFGFLGNLLDSAMGSLWQYKIKVPVWGWVDVANEKEEKLGEAGINWFTNDLVNFSAAFLTALMALWCLW